MGSVLYRGQTEGRIIVRWLRCKWRSLKKMPEIVMVEDDAVISELISFNLQNEGYAVCGFPDGKSLFKMLSQEKEPLISLFILDIMLPGMDGFEICAALRQDKRFATVPIL